jgi:flagellin
MGLGIKTLEAADNGIKAIKKLIETAQGTARQALQAASSTPTVTSSRTDLLGTTDLNAAGNGGFAAADTITVSINGAAAVVAFTADGTDTLQQVVDSINTNTTLNPAGEAQKVMASIENGRLVVESLTGDSIVVGSSAAAKLNTLVGPSA